MSTPARIAEAAPRSITPRRRVHRRLRLMVAPGCPAAWRDAILPQRESRVGGAIDINDEQRLTSVDPNLPGRASLVSNPGQRPFDAPRQSRLAAKDRRPADFSSSFGSLARADVPGPMRDGCDFMPIEHTIDHARRLVLAKGKGTLTDEDVFSYQRTVWSREDVAG